LERIARTGIYIASGFTINFTILHLFAALPYIALFILSIMICIVFGILLGFGFKKR
jgi:hypothetical protein